MRKLSGFEIYAIHEDKDGYVLWETGAWLHNALMNEGEKNVLDSYLRNQNHPSQFFARLFADTPVETDSLASLSGEPGGHTGYAPKVILRSATAAGWPTLENVTSGGDFQAESVEVVWTIHGTTPLVTHNVLATTSDNSGLLIDATELSQPRQLRSQDTFRLRIRARLA